MKEFIFFFCWVLVYSANSQRLINRIRPYNIKWIPSEEYAPNISCTLKPIDRKTTVINAEVNVIKPLTDILLRIQVFRKYNRFQPFLINLLERPCTIFTNKSNSIISRLSRQIYQRYTNFNHSCPYVGKLIAKDFQYIEGTIPSLIPKGIYRLDFTVSEKEEKNFAFKFQIATEITEETRD